MKLYTATKPAWQVEYERQYWQSVEAEEQADRDKDMQAELFPEPKEPLPPYDPPYEDNDHREDDAG